MKKLLCLVLTLVLCLSFVLTGCSNKTTNTTDDTQATTTEPKTTHNTSDAVDALEALGVDAEALDISPDIYYSDKEYGFQLNDPVEGDTIAIIHTNYGDIYAVLFEEECPNTVKNFIELANAGKYNNVIFHRVIDDFMIQGGDFENQDGTGGSTYNGEVLYDEFCDKLVNLRGSLAMANSGKDTNGSQFFINQAGTSGINFENSSQSWANFQTYIKQYANDADTLNNFLNYYYTSCYVADVVPDEIKRFYEEFGGNPYLDGAYNCTDKGHTVFGQVYDGMDVVDEIAGVDVDDNSKPTKDVIIKSIEITTY